MPAQRLFWFLALSTLLGIGGILAQPLAWLALAMDALLLLAFGLDLRRARQRELNASRQWPPMLVQGAECEVKVEVSTTAGEGLEVELREVLHPALAEAPLRQRVKLGARAGAAWSYGLRPRHRGDCLAGPLMARVRGPWGLAWSQRTLLPASERRVYPQVRWEGKVGHLLLLAQRNALGRNPQRVLGLGNEPYGLREYTPGDPPNKIHWKSTARHGHLVSREDTWEKGARLILLLDCGRGMSGLDGERSKLDHALAACLALARVATGRGDRVIIGAFNNRIERQVLMKAGPRGGHQAYAALYDLTAQAGEPAYDLAAEWASRVETRRSTVVLFTSLVDLAAAELLKSALLHLERRHRPILVNLEDGELIHLSEGAAGTPRDAYAKVSAMEIQLANRRLGRRLRRAGIRVVSTAADRLALETLENYLSLFAGRA